MRENQNWTSALIFSALFHIIAFACLSGLISWETKQHPQEEILEMALIDDLGMYGGESSGSANSPGDSEAGNSILEQPEQESVSTEQQPAPQHSPPEIKRQEQPLVNPLRKPSAKPLTEEPSINPLNEQPSFNQKTSNAASSAASGSTSSSGASAGNSEEKGSGGSSGSPGNAGTGSGNSGSGSGSGSGISPPAVLSSVKPPYPSAARQKGIEGVVELRVLILENGRAGNTSVISSSGDASLDAAALSAIKSWRFIPAKDLATGKALARYTRVSISFELK